MSGTDTTPTSAAAPTQRTSTPTLDTPAATAVDPSAADVVDRFLNELRRRDLDGLAVLLRDDRAPAGPTGDEAARDQAARDEAARDYAQIVLRSFGGSGLVETERHSSTDGQTVFVEFRRHHPDPAGWTERRTGIRLLRFTTRGATIAGITEYANPSVGSSGRVGSGGGADDRSAAAGAGRGGRLSDGLVWPSLDPVRPADPHTDRR